MSNVVTGVSGFINSISLIQNSQKQISQLNDQNTTGKKSTALQGYGTDTAKILNLNTSITETQSYISNTQQVGTFLSAYDTTLTQLKTDATSLQNSLTSLSSSASAGGVSALKTLLQGLEADVGATLNTQTGDRYLFSGTRYTTAPATDLTSSSLIPATTAAFAATPSPEVPNYDTSYSSATTVTSTASYAQQTTNISSSETTTYGVSSNDSSIQALVYAMKSAEAAINAGTTTAVGAQYLANAKSAANLALTGGTDAAGATVTGIEGLAQINAETESQVTSSETAQTTAVSTLQTQLGDLTQVDPSTVAVELTSVENQLEATYKATSTLLSLSILKYLT